VDNQAGFNFTLNFHFSQNEFFEHAAISRTFVFDDKKQTIQKIVSTEINWKSEEVNPTIEKKKKKIKKGKETKIITKVIEVDSFFNFFKSHEKGQKKPKKKKKMKGKKKKKKKMKMQLSMRNWRLLIK